MTLSTSESRCDSLSDASSEDSSSSDHDPASHLSPLARAAIPYLCGNESKPLNLAYSRPTLALVQKSLRRRLSNNCIEKYLLLPAPTITKRPKNGASTCADWADWYDDPPEVRRSKVAALDARMDRERRFRERASRNPLVCLGLHPLVAVIAYLGARDRETLGEVLPFDDRTMSFLKIRGDEYAGKGCTGGGTPNTLSAQKTIMPCETAGRLRVGV